MLQQKISDLEGSDLKLVFFLAALVILPVAFADTNISTNSAQCGKEFECKPAGDGLFWFNCYFDASGNDCRCYKGDITQCDVKKSSFSQDDWCAYQFECMKRDDGAFQFNCYFDGALSQCRCFVGDLSQCRGEKSLLNKTLLEEQERLSKTPVQSPINITGSVVAEVKAAETIKNESSSLFSVSLPKPFSFAMVGGVILVFIVALLIIAKSQGSYLDKARKFHKKAEEMHETGKEEEAKAYYKLAEEYRSKARGE